jgi:hypothetical protein
MAKSKLVDATVDSVEAPVVPTPDRQARWDALLAKYAEVNPEKYAAKKEAGEFATIPDSFQ